MAGGIALLPPARPDSPPVPTSHRPGAQGGGGATKRVRPDRDWVLGLEPPADDVPRNGRRNGSGVPLFPDRGRRKRLLHRQSGVRQARASDRRAPGDPPPGQPCPSVRACPQNEGEGAF